MSKLRLAAHPNTLDVRTTDFDIGEEKKAALIRQGIDGAENYLRWFEDLAEAPVNRPARVKVVVA